MRSRQPEQHQDEGVTLAELLVTMTLCAVVSTMVVTAVVNGYHVLRRNTSAATGQADLRKVVERLGGDIRAARSVAPGADGRHLVLWIDGNSDYKQQAGEVITWQLLASTQRIGQYDLQRITNAGTVIVEATTVVSQVAFQYCDTADPTTCAVTDRSTTALVHTTMTYNAVLRVKAANRDVDFWARLRNVAGAGA